LESEDYIAGNIDTSFLNTHTIQSKPTEELINMAKAFAIVAENNTKTNIAALNTKITESNPWLEIGKWEII
jgi:hypothetical protein